MKKAKRMNRKAEKLSKKGEFKDAIDLAEKALALLEDNLGPEHIEVAKQLCFTAGLYLEKGEEIINNEALYGHAATLETDKMKEDTCGRLVLHKLENQEGEYRNENGELEVSVAEYFAMTFYAQAVPLYERAFSIIEKGQGTTPTDWTEVLYNLHSLYQYFQIDSESEILERLRQLGLDDSMAKTWLTFLEKADVYEEKVKISSEAQHHYDEAERLYKKEKFEDAIAEYKKVLELEPEFAQAYLYLGDCYYRMAQYENALPYLKKAIKVDPKNPQAWAFLGDAYCCLQDAESAYKSFKKAVDIDPEYSNAVEKLKEITRLL